MYNLGDRIRIYTETPFSLTGGADVDPAVVTVRTKNPDDEVAVWVYGEADGKVVRDATGDYHYLVNGDVWPGNGITALRGLMWSVILWVLVKGRSELGHPSPNDVRYVAAPPD